MADGTTRGATDTGIADLRSSLKTKWEVKQKEQLHEQALYEDQLLLSTIKSTLSNPKYDF